jgi:TonB family protein
MKTGRAATTVGLAMAGLALAAWVGVAVGQNRGYLGVGVTRVGDFAYPPNTRTPGLVTLDVSVDATGAVQQVVAARDVPPLTAAAVSGVNNWKFSPAMNGGQAIGGVARVQVVFNPFNPGDVSIPNKPLLPPANASGNVSGLFQPADVHTANYAVYPANTVASGTVVLDVLVGSDGSVKRMRVLRGAAVLAGAATHAVRSWAFVPAMHEGNPADSHETVAYVFVSPALGIQ